MNTKRGFWGFEFQGFGCGVIAHTNDLEVSVGSYAVTVQPIGFFLRGPQGERYWHWDDLRAWLTRKPLAPLDAA